MTDPDHHHAFIEALKASWRAAGGPLSLTGFLRECRPVIAPLLARGVSWSWIGARVLAVYIDPKADVPVDIAPLEARKKTLIQLYSRTTLRAKASEVVGRVHEPDAQNVQVESVLEGGTTTNQEGAVPPGSTDPSPDSQDRAARRARIRHGVDLRSTLGQIESA